MLIDSFIGYLKVERNCSPHTLRAYAKDLSSFKDYIARVDESLSFLNIDTDVVRMWVAGLIDDGAAPSSVNRRMSTLRAFYKYLCAEGHLSVNPMHALQGPKCRKKLPSFVKENEIDELLDTEEQKGGYAACRNRMIMLCFYSTGIRLSELVGLDIGSVDMNSSVIKVLGKRNRERIVPFGAEMHEQLQRYLEQRGHYATGECSALFLSSPGRRISHSAVYRIVNSSLGGVTSLKKKSPHVLRHSFATAMLNNNAELGAVKELLGHKRLATTEIYTHLTFEELKRFYDKAHPRAGNN